MDHSLDWDATYEIVLALKVKYPDADMEEISLNQLLEWVLGLPNFQDDPALVNDQILMDIHQEWYEELNPL